jgi:hypothetical protein
VLIYLVNNEKIERKKSRKLKRENIKRVGFFFTKSQINALLRENFITHCDYVEFKSLLWYWQIAFKCDSFSSSYFAEEESLSLSFEFFNYSKENFFFLTTRKLYYFLKLIQMIISSF